MQLKFIGTIFSKAIKCWENFYTNLNSCLEITKGCLFLNLVICNASIVSQQSHQEMICLPTLAVNNLSTYCFFI